MKHTSPWTSFAGLLAVLLSLSVTSHAQVEYHLTDLGTSTSGAFSINAAGQAVGFLDPGSGGFLKGFRTAPNAVITSATDNLGNLGGGGSWARGINAVGQVAGSAGTIDGETRAFRTAPNQAINAATDNLGTLGGDSEGTGINSSGQVVGSSYASGRIFAFRTSPNASINPVTDNLGGGVGSYAYGINSSGQVVGCFYTGADYRAFRTMANAVINPATNDLGDFGAASSVQDRNNCAFGINDAGQAVGWSKTVDGHYHAFRTAPNAAINPATDDLGTLGYTDSIATSINSSGQVVGYVLVAPSTGTLHGFIYSNGVMQDLNSLIPADSGWILGETTSINDAGQIVGVGYYYGSRAFRLDPYNPSTPIITNITGPTGPLAVGMTATISATFTDAGTADTHACTFSWDDGTSTPPSLPAAIVSESNGSGSCSATHTYGATGVYTVGVTVKDNDNLSTSRNFEFVVIYDPSAGFVTGGGWINSPPGAYIASPSLTGNATFGFVSKYPKGANTPTGQTEFQFHVAGFTFHSEFYEWLVVSGPKAQYKGTGTVNDAGNYAFLLTATDAELPGGGGVDKFRIKIWNKVTNAVVYDNVGGSDNIDSANPQAIGAGSIVIHAR